MTTFSSIKYKASRAVDVAGSIKTLFWVSAFFHVVLMLLWVVLKVDPNTMFYLFIVVYSVMVVISFLIFRHNDELDSAGKLGLFIGIGVFYTILPFFLYVIPKIPLLGTTTPYDWVVFVIIYFPIWPLYIGLKENIGFVHFYLNLWIVILLILFLLGGGLQLTTSKLGAIGGRPSVVQGGAALQYLWDQAKLTLANLGNRLNPTRWIYAIGNASGITYYTGMIEQNKQAPVGLYLNNVRPSDPNFFEGDSVYIWADVQGKSFVDQIHVVPSCYIEKKGEGSVEPSSFDILGEEHNTLLCNFTGLTAGSYLAKVDATFNFETWAYVTYTFVDIEVKRSYELQGKNINSEMDIPSMPVSVYSNGPVMLGMAAMIDQPTGIDTKYNTREPILGVTLDNLWSEGKIGRVDEFVVLVPNDFDLVKCDRGEPVADNTEQVDGYNAYSFKREALGDPRASFQSITCRLHIKDPAKLLGGSSKAERTFVAIAKYVYVLEKSVRVNVKPS
jgi:hypothetical protein